MAAWAERIRYLPPAWMLSALYALCWIAAFFALHAENNDVSLATGFIGAAAGALVMWIGTAERHRRDREICGAATDAELFVFEKALRTGDAVPSEAVPGLRRLLSHRRRDLRRAYWLTPVVILGFALLPAALAIATRVWSYAALDVLALVLVAVARVTTANKLAQMAVYDRRLS
jgi:hypothetical protein